MRERYNWYSLAIVGGFALEILSEFLHKKGEPELVHLMKGAVLHDVHHDPRFFYYDIGCDLTYGIGDAGERYYNEALVEPEIIEHCHPDLEGLEWRLRTPSEVEAELRAKLNCIVQFSDDSSQAAEVKWMAEEIVQAIDIRYQYCH